jgi:hypothetical protein
MPEMRLTEHFNLRLNQSQRDQLFINANALGVSPSDYLRIALSIPIAVVSDYSAAGAKLFLSTGQVLRVYRELNRWGVNYNQGIKALQVIAKYIKDGARWSKDTEDFIKSRARDAVAYLDVTKEGMGTALQMLARLVQADHIVLPEKVACKLTSVIETE